MTANGNSLFYKTLKVCLACSSNVQVVPTSSTIFRLDREKFYIAVSRMQEQLKWDTLSQSQYMTLKTTLISYFKI